MITFSFCCGIPYANWNANDVISPMIEPAAIDNNEFSSLLLVFGTSSFIILSL